MPEYNNIIPPIFLKKNIYIKKLIVKKIGPHLKKRSLYRYIK